MEAPHMKKVIALMYLAIPWQSSAFMTQATIPTPKTVQALDLEFFRPLFEQNKLIDSMECEIKARSSSKIHKFKDRTEWIETVELTYRPYRYGNSIKETIVISPGANYGSRRISKLSEGPIEEYRIEFNDSKNSFIEFSHNGRGKLTGFLFGDIYRLYPCRVKSGH
jgi:hypothetical protein